jgi:hypothetical protein
VPDPETPPANHTARAAAFAASLEHDFTNHIRKEPGGIDAVMIRQVRSFVYCIERKS